MEPVKTTTKTDRNKETAITKIFMTLTVIGFRILNLLLVWLIVNTGITLLGFTAISFPIFFIGYLLLLTYRTMVLGQRQGYINYNNTKKEEITVDFKLYFAVSKTIVYLILYGLLFLIGCCII